MISLSLSLALAFAVTVTGCPAHRACESASDCPEPDQQLCAQLKDFGVPAEVCEEGADTDCIPRTRGCKCIVGSTAGNLDVVAGEERILCID